MRLKHLGIIKLDSNRLDSYSGTTEKKARYQSVNKIAYCEWEKIKSLNKCMGFHSSTRTATAYRHDAQKNN